jgi:hypothetical protein
MNEFSLVLAEELDQVSLAELEAVGGGSVVCEDGRCEFHPDGSSVSKWIQSWVNGADFAYRNKVVLHAV